MKPKILALRLFKISLIFLLFFNLFFLFNLEGRDLRLLKSNVNYIEIKCIKNLYWKIIMVFLCEIVVECLFLFVSASLLWQVLCCFLNFNSSLIHIQTFFLSLTKLNQTTRLRNIRVIDRERNLVKLVFESIKFKIWNMLFNNSIQQNYVK